VGILTLFQTLSTKKRPKISKTRHLILARIAYLVFRIAIRQSFPHQMTTGTYLVRDRQGKLYSLRTSVLLQFQILFDGVEKSMNSSKDFP